MVDGGGHLVPVDANQGIKPRGVGVRGDFGLGLAPGEKNIVGAVVPTNRDSFDVAATIRACRENLDRNSVPDYLQVLDAIPKTASEKPQERFLVEAFESNACDVYATSDFQ